MKKIFILLLATVAISAPVQYGNSTNYLKIQLKSDNVYEADTKVPLVIGKTSIGDAIAGAVLSSGYDIVVTNGAGTLVPREIVDFDKSDSTFQMFFQDPAINASTGGTELYLQWGGDSVANDATLWANCHGSTDDYLIVVHGEKTSANLVDASGNQILTDANITYAQTGKILKAPYFNGTDANSKIGSFSQARTIIAWVRSSDVSISQALLSQRVSDLSNMRHTISTHNNRLGVSFYNGSGVYEHRSSIVSNDTWYHIASTSDGAVTATLKFYINGVDIVDNTAVLTSPSTLGFTIGSFNDDTNYFNGYIDEVRLFRGQLSENQIKTQYDNQDGFNTNATLTIGSASNFKSSINSFYKKKRKRMGSTIGIGFH